MFAIWLVDRIGEQKSNGNEIQGELCTKRQGIPEEIQSEDAYHRSIHADQCGGGFVPDADIQR